MADNKPASNLSGPTIEREIERYSKMEVWEYTVTLYDANHKLLDDGIDLDSEISYWETFLDPRQAAELSRRLAIVEADGYEGDMEFEQMEDEDAQ